MPGVWSKERTTVRTEVRTHYINKKKQNEIESNTNGDGLAGNLIKLSFFTFSTKIDKNNIKNMKKLANLQNLLQKRHFCRKTGENLVETCRSLSEMRS
ncbi:hypothetical protein DTX80_12685 [Bacilli bacterium]|nr:hypothetical protein WH51_05200 [Bacilli bacterium VT-13-104]PZD84309.1 hypothetical protein DEJ64_12260 [Bacilli bacterium]PZD86002.1 hypothetical protein DEJ60_11190 [Bacilli bacterium]PZD89224.1 hypothetical protein DEJ66_11890 [Bacilli bacterium]RCO05190.1 hypothetical protein DTX80_12685 [Bacilli bacterium]